MRFLTASLLVVAALAAAASVEGSTVHHPVEYIPESDGRRLIGGSDVRSKADDPAAVRRCTLCSSMCQRVNYKDLCMTLTTLPGVTTPEALVDASMRVSASKTRRAAKKAMSAMASFKGNRFMEGALRGCVASYTGAAGAFDAARDAFKAGIDMTRVRTYFYSGYSFVVDCDNMLSEPAAVRSPIAGTQRNVRRIVTNSLGLFALIKY